MNWNIGPPLTAAKFCPDSVKPIDITVSEALARVVATQYYPKNNVVADRIEGIDASMADAVAFKYISAPLTKEQLAELILVPLR